MASPYLWLLQRKNIFHFIRFTLSLSLAPTLFMFSLSKYIRLLLDFSLFLLPDTAISTILFPTWPSSFLFTCPYQRGLALGSLSPSFAIFKVPLTYWFLILSFLVTPSAHLTIPTLHLPFFPSCLSVTATVSAVHFTLLTLADDFLSHKTPDIFFQLIHPAWICLLTSLHLPSLLTVEPSYLKFFTLFTFSPCGFNSSPSSTLPTFKYSVLLRLTFRPLFFSTFCQISRSSSSSQ